VHISFLKEARNALSYRHSRFHIINRPQPGRVLKYFMRLVAIGFAYAVKFDDRGSQIWDYGKKVARMFDNTLAVWRRAARSALEGHNLKHVKDTEIVSVVR
jgi:hypothetical protein